MEETIKNCAEEVPLEERINSAIGEGKINYVPHHGIYHPKKLSQIRVVFDCSATFKGTSLNKSLLSGPDMTNSLTGVLCHFRQEWVAMTCDVKGMFHQFFVNKEHRDLLRFFWWDKGDIKNDPGVYRMKVHLFEQSRLQGAQTLASRERPMTEKWSLAQTRQTLCVKTFM